MGHYYLRFGRLNSSLSPLDQNGVMRRVFVVCVLLGVVLASCSTSTPETATSSPSPAGAESASSTSAPTATSLSGDQSSGDSASNFDASFLSLGPGQSFPVLDEPVMVAAATATWMEPDDVVLGVVRGNEAYAFPASQMAFHHIANVTIAGEPYLVTY